MIAVAVAAGCSVLTKAYDYQVGPPENADGGASGDAAADAAPIDTRACAFCARSDLAHVPCAPNVDAGDGGASYAYVVTRVDFGADPTTWTNPQYAAGLDQDCADRDGGGAPSTCTRAASSRPVPALPRGIDNAFATQIVAPIKADALDAGSADLQANVNAWVTAGGAGVAIFVDGWNGAADDDDVRVRLLSVAPNDDAGAHVFDESSEPFSADGYVVSGTLVADFRTQSYVNVRLGTAAGARLELHVFDTLLVGAITPSSLERLTLAGKLVSGGQLGAGFATNLAQLAYGCAASHDAVDPLVNDAFDLGAGGSACNAISLGLVLSAKSATFGAPVSAAGIPSSCP
jgi:hypothetical protein